MKVEGEAEFALASPPGSFSTTKREGVSSFWRKPPDPRNPDDIPGISEACGHRTPDLMPKGRQRPCRSLPDRPPLSKHGNTRQVEAQSVKDSPVHAPSVAATGEMRQDPGPRGRQGSQEAEPPHLPAPRDPGRAQNRQRHVGETQVQEVLV